MTLTPARPDDAISDDDISVLVDVARSAGTILSGDKRDRLPALMDRGLIAPATSGMAEGDRYMLTPEGQAALDARGVGANEA